MSEKHPPEKKAAPVRKSATGERKYGKPAGAGAARPATGERKYGKPAGAGAARPATGERKYGKPAGTGTARPATGERKYGKPAGAGAAHPVTGERKFGKPAGATSARPATGERKYGKPAGTGTARPATGERKYGKPAGAGAARPATGERKFGRPAGTGAVRPATGERKFGRPVSAVRRAPVVKQETTGLSTSARRVAMNILLDVDKEGAYASLALQKRLTETQLSPADKRLCTSIVYGTLENRIRIDYLLDHFMTHPTGDPMMRNILRLSAYQLLFLDRVPESAAVNEGVNLVKLVGMEPAAGFANAVLRNLARAKASLPYPKREDDVREYLHIMESMPLWIVDRLVSAYGPEVAEDIIRYRPDEHEMTLRPNMMKLDDAAFEALLAKKVWNSRRGLVPHAFLVSGASDVGMDRDFRSGMFSIQGQGSMLAAQAVGAKPGMKLLDACAAPGGKACYLAEMMQGTGRVYAWDLHEHRAQLIEGAMRRLRLDNLRVTVRNAAEPKPDMDGTLDAVLLDAPCTGLGVMLEKPDVKLRVQESSVAEIAETQRQLLDAVCAYVKPGGLLVYSTCSILPEENSQQIEAFLQRHPEFSVERIPGLPDQLAAEQTALGLQLLSCRDGTEGFYIARLRRERA